MSGPGDDDAVAGNVQCREERFGGPELPQVDEVVVLDLDHLVQADAERARLREPLGGGRERLRMSDWRFWELDSGSFGRRLVYRHELGLSPVSGQGPPCSNFIHNGLIQFTLYLVHQLHSVHTAEFDLRV